MVRIAAAACVVALSACGSSSGAPARATGHTQAGTPAGGTTAAAAVEWTRFGYDAARSNNAPTGPGAAELAQLKPHTVDLPGTVDSSPILAGGKLLVTTTYGLTLALDPADGHTIWRFTPGGYERVKGSAQITTTTPIADPDRRSLYAASPDGFIHKLRLADGKEVTSGGWPVSLTRDATHEKIPSALNIDGRNVLATTGGYIGDAPPYQGKLVAIDRSSGRIAHVWNSLCSDRRRIIKPSACPASDSAIWGRGGAVVDPVTHRIYVSTGNAPFDGRTNWGDSLLELAPAAAKLLRSYTPGNQAELESGDADLGSASPALLPDPRSASRRTRFILQGGKDNRLRLLKLSSSLHSPSARLGGEVQVLPQPGGSNVFTAPAVLHRKGVTQVFVATFGGTAAYTLRGGRLKTLWSKRAGGTSPVIAGGLLYVYDPGGGLDVYRPASGALVHRFDVPGGHWNSPIVAGGRLYVPSGDANEHSTAGALTIFG